MDGPPDLKLDATRFTSSGGAGAPPPPTLTRLDVSNSGNRGDSSRSQLWVGTPTKLVMRSRSMSSRARSGFHLYMITSFNPAEKQESITGTQPVTWKSGTMRMNDGAPAGAGASGRRARSMAPRHPKPNRACTMDRWVETAPLGRPVVPDV